MNPRTVAFYTLVTLVLIIVISIVHRHVGGLAPAPPVDVSNITMPVAPIPLPVVAAPTILQSQGDDSEMPTDLDHTLARRPDSPVAGPPNLPESIGQRSPDDALLVPIPESEP